MLAAMRLTQIEARLRRRNGSQNVNYGKPRGNDYASGLAVPVYSMKLSSTPTLSDALSPDSCVNVDVCGVLAGRRLRVK